MNAFWQLESLLTWVRTHAVAELTTQPAANCIGYLPFLILCSPSTPKGLWRNALQAGQSQAITTPESTHAPLILLSSLSACVRLGLALDSAKSGVSSPDIIHSLHREASVMNMPRHWTRL